MKAKSLIRYKIGYDPDKNQKSKSAEAGEDGERQNFVTSIVASKKNLEFMINGQIPLYEELATALDYTGLEKFHNCGQHYLGVFKAAWENELVQSFCTNALRTAPAFDRALVGTWQRINGQTDLRKAALNMTSKLNWKKIFRKHKNTLLVTFFLTTPSPHTKYDTKSNFGYPNFWVTK